MISYHIAKRKRGVTLEILDSILELRSDYGNYEEDENFRVFDVALPVAVYECSANQKTDSIIDSLAKTVLKFIKFGINDNSELGKLLCMTPDMVKRVKTQKLEPLGFIDEKSKITEEGEKCLNDDLEDSYQEERIYGNMFVSLVDGEIMPFFWEGSLPFANGLSVFDYPNVFKVGSNNLVDVADLYLPNFTEAYKKHHQIREFSRPQMEYTDDDTSESPYSSPQETDEFDMLSSGFDDVLFSDINNSSDYDGEDDDEEYRTYDDVVQEEKESREYVKVFNSTKKLLYVYTKMVVNRNNPEDFIILSPFPDNITTWYAKRIPFMQLDANNITISSLQTNNTVLFGDFTKDITQEFLIQYPELADSNFEFYAKSHFPNLAHLKTADKNLLKDVLKKYYNSYVLNSNGKNSSNEVITLMGLALETILNVFVSKINNRASVCNNYILVPYDKITYQDIFQRFGIADCSGHAVSSNLAQKLRSWGKNNSRIKGSPTEKYCFLILEGYIHSAKPTPFIKIIKKYGKDFIEKLDNVIEMRNKYTSHNDNIGGVETITKDSFNTTKDNFVYVMSAMINALYEFEKGE